MKIISVVILLVSLANAQTYDYVNQIKNKPGLNGTNLVADPLGLQGSGYRNCGTPGVVTPGPCGGMMNVAASGVTFGNGYLANNWYFGNSISDPNTYTDRFARNGGSCLVAMGSQNINGNDAVSGEFRVSCTAADGVAGATLATQPWNAMFHLYGTGESSYTNNPLHYIPTMYWRMDRTGALANLFVDTYSTIATPGLTALANAIVPSTIANQVHTGNQRTLALEGAFDSSGNYYWQPRDYGASATAHNTIFNKLGGNFGVKLTGQPAYPLDVHGVINTDNSMQIIADSDCSTTVGSLSIFGATNALKQLTICLNTSTTRVTDTSILNGTGYIPKDFKASTITVPSVNYAVDTSSGANAAIAAISQQPVVNGLTITVQLIHTLQAGANTVTYNGVGYSLKSHFNPANNIGTAYAATGVLHAEFNGTVFLDLSQ